MSTRTDKVAATKARKGIIKEALDAAAEIRHKNADREQEILAKAEAVALKLKEAQDTHPTNKELQETIRKTEETIRVHTDHDTIEFQAVHREFDQMHQRLDNLPTQQDIAVVVEAVITKTLLSKGKTAYSLTIGAGALAVALIAIVAGFKLVIAWFGFTSVMK